MTAAHIRNNMVINLIATANLEILNKYPGDGKDIFCEYNGDIHPWGPNGPLDIEIGLNWKERLKQKLGYCIFCMDGLIPETQNSGSL